jgi:UDP-glucuronate 4-epimerase
MNILLTGCAGFIGQKVSSLLLQEGHTVIGVDNLNTAYDVRLKRWRLQQLKADPKFSFHYLDITDRKSVNEFFEFVTQRQSDTTNLTVEAVINLAARAGVNQSLHDPWLYYETNITGTLNLLDLCRRNGIKKFILSSTSSVYGDTQRPFREDQHTEKPLSPYAASKKAAEGICYTYHYLYGLDVTVLRYFTVYGPAGRPDMSIFRFVKWITENEPVIVYGNGLQERDFTYIDDIAKGTLLALKRTGYEVINLGSDRPVALITIIALLEDILEKRAFIEYNAALPGDIPSSWADISKAIKLLGWAPSTNLETGLEQTVDWYRHNQDWAHKVDLP